MTSEERKELKIYVENLISSGLHRSQIVKMAQKRGVPDTTIYRWLDQAGVEKGSHGNSNDAGIAMHVADGKNSTQIAKEMNLNIDNISRNAKRLGIKIPTKTEDPNHPQTRRTNALKANAKKMYRRGFPTTEIAKRLEIHITTFYRSWIPEYSEEDHAYRAESIVKNNPQLIEMYTNLITAAWHGKNVSQTASEFGYDYTFVYNAWKQSLKIDLKEPKKSVEEAIRKNHNSATWLRGKEELIKKTKVGEKSAAKLWPKLLAIQALVEPKMPKCSK